tara:strand:+ start:4822 stop:5841 length:1020 start_codon:yes stop_codon:yes gene_type:complete
MLIFLINILVFQILISFIILYISIKKNLVDNPDYRKIHLLPTPYTGGLILGITYIFIIYISDFNDKSLNSILAYGLIICLTGFIDDRYNVRPGTKILLQAIPIFFLIDQSLYLNDLGNYEIFGTIELGSVNKIFTFLCCLLLINAFNYTDGIDGLLCLISIIIILSFSFFLFLTSEFSNYDNLIILSFPLIIFLFFNFGFVEKFKIFLGDSGSNFLGFKIAFLAIYLYEIKDVHPALIVWPLAYIVYEFLSVTILRILRNEGTFKAGRDHLHYEITNYYNVSYTYSLIIILIFNLLLIGLGTFIFTYFGPDYSILLFISLFTIYLFTKFQIQKKTNNKF